MNLCIPVTEDRGLRSPVCEHFGSAPLFLIVDTESRACRALPNRNAHHGHGMCQPLAALAGERIGALAVGGIGRGAIEKLRMAGVRVYLSDAPTVEETVVALAAGTLREATPATACGGHGHGPQADGHAGPGRPGHGPGGCGGRP